MHTKEKNEIPYDFLKGTTDIVTQEYQHVEGQE